MNKRGLLTWIGTIAAIVIIAAGTWIYLVRAPPERFTGPREKLTMAEASQPGFALVYVADAKGYLKEAGLDVTFNSFTLGKDALNSVLEGKSDLATVFQTPVVMRIYEGKPLAILSTLFTSTRSTKLVARADHGIATPRDLRGKRVGMTLGTTTEYFLSLFLATESIPQDAVIRVHVEPAGYDSALLEGRVDALVLFNPHTIRIRKALGERAVEFPSDAYIDKAMLVGTHQTLAARPVAMMRLVKAITRAQDYVETNREDSIRIVAARLAGKFDEALIREGWDDFKLEAKLDNVLLSIMTLEAQWYRTNGKFSGSVPDFRKSIVAEPLRAARPHAVTLLPMPAPQ